MTGPGTWGLLESEMNEMIKRLDADGDQQISFEEFSAFFDIETFYTR